MQTFMPYDRIELSIPCLDYKRLGKQRVEAFQILCALNDPWANSERLRRGNKGQYISWSNHPAVKMWEGYENALKLYMNSCIGEWCIRGYNNTMRMAMVHHDQIVYPWWFGLEIFHLSHRNALMVKDPDYYSRFGWPEPMVGYSYVWPSGKFSPGKYIVGAFVNNPNYLD